MSGATLTRTGMVSHRAVVLEELRGLCCLIAGREQPAHLLLADPARGSGYEVVGRRAAPVRGADLLPQVSTDLVVPAVLPGNCGPGARDQQRG
ncbi:hypothetical protein [Streptomyces sp. NPDC048577]|uniref:hypothetical protein n=1 Tax=Streptomyces sp. NPDC048577 TaxID=3157209 RepID=UPI00342EBC4E